MSSSDEELSELEVRLYEVIGDYYAASERGDRPDRREILERNADLASDLMQFFNEQDQFHRVTEPLRIMAKSFASAERATDRPAGLPIEGGSFGEQASDRWAQLGYLDSEGESNVLSNFGDYELLSEIARGGMGVIYRARQRSLNRPVALKMILAGRYASDNVRSRFRAEAESVANLDHPHIVSVYEVGEHDGISYFSMKLIEGPSLAEQLSRGASLPTSAARLVATVARALHHAHQRGVLHRDLKPSNILLDGNGQPHITDFGLAKRLGEDLELTRSGEILGSPPYMAQEQTLGANGAITIATDVYGLGAVLYAVLTGRPPFQGNSVLETIEMVRVREPASLSAIDGRIDHDLDAICMKCLEKNPLQRYGSALELAEELERWLIGEPVRARRVSQVTKGWRWAKRNPIATGAGIVLGLLVLIVIGTLAWAQKRTTAALSKVVLANTSLTGEQKVSRAALERAERLSAGLALDRASSLSRNGEFALGMLWLAKGLESAVRARDESLERALRFNLTAFQQHAISLVTEVPHAEAVVSVAFHPNGRIFATGCDDGRIWFWDTDGKPAGPPQDHVGPATSLKISADGSVVLAGCADGAARLYNIRDRALLGKPMRQGEGALTPLLILGRDGGIVITAGGDRLARIWDGSSGRLLLPPLEHQEKVTSMASSPDGKQLATGCRDGVVRVWDIASGKCAIDLKLPGRVSVVAFNPDGQSFLAGFESDVGLDLEGEARLFGLPDGREIGPPIRVLTEGPRHGGGIHDAAFSPGGKSVVVVKESGALHWDLAAGRPIGLALSHPAPIDKVIFAPNRATFLTICADNAARVWLPDPGRQLGQPLMHSDKITGAAYSPDGVSAVTVGLDKKARLWTKQSSVYLSRVLMHSEIVFNAAFAPDSQVVITSTIQGLHRWNAKTGTTIGGPFGRQGFIHCMTFRPDGKILATGGMGLGSGDARFWDVSTGSMVGEPLPHPARVRCLAYSPDGRFLATGCDDGAVRLWDTTAQQPVGEPMFHSFSTGRADQPPSVLGVAFRTDGKALLTYATDAGARLWDVASGQPIGPPLHDQVVVNAATFSLDGTCVLTGGSSGEAVIWDADTGALIGPRFHHRGVIASVAFSPDRRTVVTGGTYSGARLWNVADGQPIGGSVAHRDLISNNFGVSIIAFSPDGRMVATGASDFSARLWDASNGNPLTPPLWHSDQVRVVAFSPDGRTLLTAGSDRTAQLWKVPIPVDGDVKRITLWAETIAGMELDDEGVAHDLERNTWDERRRQLQELGGPPIP